MYQLDRFIGSFFPYKSAMILWTSIVLFAYYAIMVLMGTLSTDLTVPIIKRLIETLNDLLYDSEFNNIEPVISNQLNMYIVSKNSRNGTNEHVLYERIK